MSSEPLLPIEVLAAEFSSYSGDREIAWKVLTQLSVPPTLVSLRAGLQKSKAWLDVAANDLDACLAMIPGARLSAGELKSAIDILMNFVDAQGWASDDPRLAPLGRTHLGAKHPQHGTSKSLLHHWVNLFYIAEGDPAESSTDAIIQQDYDELMAGFSAYSVASYSYVSADHYRNFCNIWRRHKVQPSIPLFEDSRISSRIGAGSQALRRLGAMPARSLLNLVRSFPTGTPLHERIRGVLASEKLSDFQRKELRNIDRLISNLRPGWHGTTARAKSGGSSRGTARQSLGDGFVQIAGSPLAVFDVSGDGGEEFSLIYLREDDDEGADEDEGLESKPVSDTEVDADPEWIPLADRLISEPFVTFKLDEAGEPLPSISSRPLRSAWADAQLRRIQFAHRLATSRLSRREFDGILRSADDLPVCGGDPPRLIAIVLTALMTGDKTDKARLVQILSGKPANRKPLAYRMDLSRWERQVIPPAWRDMRVTRSERPLEEFVWLPDDLGFRDFLKKHGLDRDEDLGIHKITAARRSFIQSWLQAAAQDRHLTLAVVENALFSRVLEASNGDVAIAQLVTGRPHSHSASAAHYSHYTQAVVSSTYRAAIADLDAKASSRTAKNSPVEAGDNANAESDRGVGARRVPTTASIAALLSQLRKDFRAAWKRGDITSAHNLFTTYTLIGLALAIALRAVVDPHLRDMASISRCITFWDKARTDYHRRVSVLPEIIVRQLLAYTSYLRRRMPHLMTNSDGSPISFAYIDPVTGIHEPYRPLHFQLIVGHLYDLEFYGFRRYFRSTLAENANVSKEDLDSAMGHWWEGVSPHDRLSTFPMHRLVALADGPVKALLRGVDFRVMEPQP